MMSDKYILKDKTPVPCPDLMEWAEWFEKGNRRVAQTTIGKLRVSTVFLGLDHSFDPKGPPLLFETMVFGDDDDGEICERCSTWEQAKKQHEKICALIEKGKS